MNLSHKKLEEILNTAPALLAYLSFPECGVCQVLRPKVEALLEKYDAFEFLYVDIHKYPQISGQRLVFTVPTILVMQNGREVKRYSRHFALQEHESSLDKLTVE